MTCDNTTSVCPGTELTCCTCSVHSPGLTWTLPGSATIRLDDKFVGSNNATDGIFFAVVTNNIGGVLESMLIYTATESLVNATIKCEEEGIDDQREFIAVTCIITVAG